MMMPDNDRAFDEAFQEWADHWREARGYPQPGCLTPLQVVNYADGSMGWRERRHVEGHLQSCPYCLRETLKAQKELSPARSASTRTTSRVAARWAYGLAFAAVLALVVFAWNREVRLRASDRQRKTLIAQVDTLKQQNKSLRQQDVARREEMEKVISSHKQLEQKVAQLQNEYNKVKSLLAQSATQQPSVLVTLRDVSAKVTVGSDGAVRLSGQATLPPSLSHIVHELVTEGTVKPTQPVRLAMEALRGDATRSALRSAENMGKPIPISPMLTAVRSTRPTLRWEPVPGAQGYKVRVTDRDEKVVWEGSAGTQTQFTLPAGALQQGLVYFWDVETTVGEESRVSPAVGFWALPAKTLREVEAAERKYKTSALVLASVYEAHGLYEDALAQVERLNELNPTSLIVEGKLHKLRQQLGRENSPGD